MIQTGRRIGGPGRMCKLLPAVLGLGTKRPSMAAEHPDRHLCNRTNLDLGRPSPHFECAESDRRKLGKLHDAIH